MQCSFCAPTGAAQRRVCRFFNTRGGCRYGAGCRDAHMHIAASSSPGQTPSSLTQTVATAAAAPPAIFRKAPKSGLALLAAPVVMTALTAAAQTIKEAAVIEVKRRLPLAASAGPLHKQFGFLTVAVPGPDTVDELSATLATVTLAVAANPLPALSDAVAPASQLHHMTDQQLAGLLEADMVMSLDLSRVSDDKLLADSALAQFCHSHLISQASWWRSQQKSRDGRVGCLRSKAYLEHLSMLDLVRFRSLCVFSRHFSECMFGCVYYFFQLSKCADLSLLCVAELPSPGYPNMDVNIPSG
jgi:hypothetical protein